MPKKKRIYKNKGHKKYKGRTLAKFADIARKNKKQFIEIFGKEDVLSLKKKKDDEIKKVIKKTQEELKLLNIHFVMGYNQNIFSENQNALNFFIKQGIFSEAGTFTIGNNTFFDGDI